LSKSDKVKSLYKQSGTKMHQPGIIQHHNQLHNAGLVIQLPQGLEGSQTYVLDASGNVTLSGGSGNILTVDGHLVQGHAQVQEVHLTDERGNVQQVGIRFITNLKLFYILS
jgi:prepilin-type processing-associated H-X9-DG protein